MKAAFLGFISGLVLPLLISVAFIAKSAFSRSLSLGQGD